MCACTHTCTHACAHTHARAHTCTCARTHIYAHTCTHARTHINVLRSSAEGYGCKSPWLGRHHYYGPQWQEASRASTTSCNKSHHVVKCYRGSWTRREFLENVSKRKWTWDIGIWNMRSLYVSGLLKTIARKLLKWNLNLVGVEEVR